MAISLQHEIWHVDAYWPSEQIQPKYVLGYKLSIHPTQEAANNTSLITNSFLNDFAFIIQFQHKGT